MTELSTRLRMEPKSHQLAASSDVIDALTAKGQTRAQLVSACGTGKTLTAQLVAEAVATTGIVVVTVPTILLLEQTLTSWLRGVDESGMTSFDWLAVTGDRTVGQEVLEEDVERSIGRVTREVSDIVAFLEGSAPRKVVFVTHVSTGLVGDALIDLGLAADMLIVDEAHRASSAVDRGSDTETLGSVVLHDSRLPASYRLFLTATPRLYSGEARSETVVASMDDTRLFGEVAHEYPFRQAVDDGILVDFSVVVSLVREGELSAHRHHKVQAAQVALGKLMVDQEVRKVVTFHNRVASAQEFTETLAEHVSDAVGLDVRSYHINGSTTGDVRDAVMRVLDNRDDPTPAVVSNARVLTEGIDVPDLDAVVFADSRASVVDVTQAVGRAVRYHPGKTRGIVLIPVLVPDTDDLDALMESRAWRDVWRSIAALKGLDPDLVAEFARARFERLENQGDGAVERIRVVGSELTDEMISRIYNKVVELSADSWEVHYQALLDYVQEHGTSKVPAGYVTDSGLKLGSWARTQRSLLRPS